MTDFTMRWDKKPCSKDAMLVLPLFLLGVLLPSVTIVTADRASRSNPQPIVTTQSGRVQGVRKTVVGKDVQAFLGIPYADPPVGSRRFQRPVNKTAWDGVLDASRYGYACHQVVDHTYPGFAGSEMWNPNVNVSEDCLNLNIWSPGDARRNASLAVMVWIFGGGFNSGCASLDVYNGEVLSTVENVIVVTINYRVASLGFLAMGGVDDSPGNMGLLDQALALAWVQENIRAFGGDPDRVTIFGESAGAVSVNLHMMSPVSRDLFARAILESGSSVVPWGVLSNDEALRRGLRLAESVECYTPSRLAPDSDEIGTIVDCLRTISPEELIANEFVVGGTYIFPFVAVVDGEFLKETPKSALTRGSFKSTEIMLGTNTNEGSFFMVYYLPGFDKDTDSLLNRTAFIEHIALALPHMNEFGRDAIAFEYTDWLDPDNEVLLRDATEAYVADYNIICPVHEFARYYASSGNKVFAYHFDQRSASNMWGEWMGVMHGDEIAFVFGQPLRSGYGFSQSDAQLSSKMMSLWGNFAKTGDPNRVECVGTDDVDVIWPAFDKKDQNVFLLRDSTVDTPESYIWNRANYCAFWEEYVPFLNTQTANIDESERQWKEDFYQWSTKYMVDWKAEFNHYLYNKETGCSGEGYNETP